MTFTDAAAEVLRLIGRPLHYKEITDIAIEKNLLSHVGKSPEVTMGARLAATLKKESPDNPLVRVKPGVFALREWDEKTLRASADGKKGKKASKSDAGRARTKGAAGDEYMAEDTGAADSEDTGAVNSEDTGAADSEDTGAADEPAIDDTDESGAVEEPIAAHADTGDEDAHVAEPVEVPAVAVPSAKPSTPARIFAASDDIAGDDDEPAEPDEVMRAEAAAGAAEIFDEEEDDDQPILGTTDDRAVPVGGAEPAEGRRRRRRRRRGRSANGEASPPGGGGLPSYTATPAFDSRRDTPRDVSRDGSRELPREAFRETAEPLYRGPHVIELTGGDNHASLDDLAGRELSDAIAAILSSFDRNAGAVSLRQIAETAQRRGRLAGDAQLVQSQVAAAVRADNARRLAAGQRPRFRFAGGRVALTDWLLTNDLARLEQEAIAAVERYRDAARRAFARKLAELPGHAFVEVCVLALERVGIGQLRAVRRPGAAGGETHFSAILRSAGDEIRLAVVIRRDGREVGRERVTELRGSLHHYGPASAGWIVTSGQALSGAREEASIAGAAPIAIYDGLAIAKLCEENDVAVVRARMPIAIPDIDLLEALRAS